MDGFFPIKTAKDLRDKLRRDLEKIRADRHNADLYFNFFVTAEALSDYVVPGRAHKKAREALRSSSKLLEVCSHLASGAKHLKVEAGHHRSVVVMKFMRSRFIREMPPGYVDLDMFPPYLGMVLGGEAALVLGDEHAMEGFAHRVNEFWQKYPLTPEEEGSPWFPSKRSLADGRVL